MGVEYTFTLVICRTKPETVYAAHVHALSEVEVLIPVYAIVHSMTIYSMVKIHEKIDAKREKITILCIKRALTD